MKWHEITLRRKMAIVMGGFFLMITGISFAAMLHIMQFNQQLLLVDKAAQLQVFMLKVRHFEEEYIAKKDAQDYEQLQDGLKRVHGNLRQIAEGRGDRVHLPHVEKVMASLNSYEEATVRLQRSRADGMTTPAHVAEVVIRGDNLTNGTYALLEDAGQSGAKAVGPMQKQFAGLLVVILFVAGALAIWGWQGVFQPLKEVVRAAHAVAKNTYEPMPMGDGPDEIRQVFMAFNSMASDLQPRYAGLMEATRLTSLGTLASGAAHQLNNPLNNISTSCQIALVELEEGDVSFIKKMLSTIQQESMRASNIVRGLLEFSRSPVVHLAPGHIDNIVKGVLQLVACEVPAGVAVKTDIAENLLVHVDGQKMTEVMINLVSNSIQSLGENDGEISITAWVDDEQAQVIVKVRDTGEGIDEGQLKNIFEPFFTTKKAQSSAGLGLAIVDGIIQKHQGRITVESTRGDGAEFTITLPLLQTDQDSVVLGEQNKKV